MNIDSITLLRKKRLLSYTYGIIIISLLAVTFNDLTKGYPIDASIEGASALLALIFVPFLLKKDLIKIASLLLIVLLSIVCISAMILDTFDHLSVVFIVGIIPIAFYLLGRKIGLAVSIILLSISGFLLTFATFFTIHHSSFLNSPIAITNFIVFAIVITGVSYIYESTNHYSYALLIEETKKREILYKEIHHRVKNSLNIVSSILGLQALNAPKKTAQLLLRSQDRIHAIALLHTMLYHSSHLDAIEPSQYFESLIGTIRQSLDDNAITVDIHIPQHLILPMNTVVSLGIITNELIANSIKHAFAKTPDPKISLTLTQQSYHYHFVYTDNGSSCSEATLFSHNGLGSHLIRLSVEQLNGILQIKFSPSLEYTIIFGEKA